MPAVERLLKDMPSASRAVYLRWISLLPTAIDASFTKDHIMRGWLDTGLAPVDVPKILDMNPSWKFLTVAQRAACVAAAHKLASPMLEKGQLTDAELQAAVGAALVFPVRDVYNAAGRKVRKELHEMTIPRRRAVILTNRYILQERSGAPDGEESGETSEEVEIFQIRNCLTSRNAGKRPRQRTKTRSPSPRPASSASGWCERR